MKKFLILAVFASVNVFASDITLTPGSSATIAAGEVSNVTCMGTADMAPRCSFKVNSQGYYDVFIGAERATTQASTVGALAEIKAYKNAGICR
jgi:hypothetical protein